MILNRAQVVTILYRISGSEEEIDPVGFTDVPEDTFYYYPVGWAQENGIVQGFTETTFGPTVTVTNQQLVTFLYRYVDSYEGLSHYLPEPDVAENLDDYSSVQPFAQDALNWAMNCGVVSSYGTQFYPNREVTREVCANYLYLFLTLALGNAKVLSSYLVAAATESSSAKYFPDYWAGEEICDSLNKMTEQGYNATAQCIMTPLAAEFALYNSEVVYIVSHGKPSYLLFDYGTLLYNQVESFSMLDCDFAFISACLAGNTFCEHLWENALADCVVGFKEEIRFGDTYPGNITGVNLFDQMVFENYSIGYSIPDAIEVAKIRFSTENQKLYGIDSVFVYE